MRKLDAIKKRLAAYNDPATNTEDKLESGAIVDFVQYSHEDVEWLLDRVGELTRNGQKVLEWIDRSGWTGFMDGLLGLRVAVRRTLNEEEKEQ